MNMAPTGNFLVQLLGTSTKVRLFQHLCLDPTPLRRHALSQAIEGGAGPTYEQVDQLIALGALKEVEGRIGLDPVFPFLDDLSNLVATTANYLEDLRPLLERLDNLLGSDYYISGYLAARQYGAPLDYDRDSALVALFNPNPRYSRFLRALTSATTLRLDRFEVQVMPPDVRRETLYDATVWLASVERGLVDCVVHNDCPPYVVLQLLLQNLLENSLDWNTLLSISKAQGGGDFFLAGGAELNHLASEPLVRLNPDEVEQVAPLG